ncbi:MAG: LysR family transcriptional regulator [Pikeienuella sp.]
MTFGLSGLESLSVKHLAIISELAHSRSVSAAARALGYSQPTVSKGLAYAEAQIGYPLFARSARGVVPTTRGMTLVRHANLIVRNLQAAAEEITGQGEAAKLSIGLHTGPSAFIPANLFGSVHVGGDFNATARYGTHMEAMAMLREGHVDIFFGDVSLLEDEFVRQDLFDDTYVIVAKSTKRNRETLLTPADFSAKSWVLPEEGSKLRRMFDHYTAVNGIEIKGKTFTTNNEAVRFTLCAIADYVMLWPAKMAAFLSSSDLWITSHEIDGAAFTFSAAYRADHPKVTDIEKGVARIAEITSAAPFATTGNSDRAPDS